MKIGEPFLAEQPVNQARYDRQIRLQQVGLEGQTRLQTSTVVIIGCGALGTYAAEQLVRAGLGHLLLIDPDTIEESNLQRQALFEEADCGYFKVEVAARHLKGINSACDIETRALNFEQALFDDSDDKGELGNIDLLLDCTDNFLAREAINDYCLDEKLPFIFSSCAGTAGQVMFMRPDLGPCLSCVFPDVTDLEQNCETIGVLTPLIPLISSLQISLALKYLLKTEEVDYTRMYVVNAWSPELTSFKISKQESCKVCQGKHQEEALSRACGQVFRGVLPITDFETLSAYCAKQGWTCHQTKLALQISFDDFEITVFKNGRALFYGFKDVQPLFDRLVRVLKS